MLATEVMLLCVCIANRSEGAKEVACVGVNMSCTFRRSLGRATAPFLMTS